MATIKNKKYKLHALLSRLSKARRNTKRPSFNSFVYNQILSVLQTAIVFPDDVCDQDKRGIIASALLSRNLKKEIKVEAFLSEVEKFEKEYLSRPRNPYILVATISIPEHINSLTRSIDNTSITISNRLPKLFDRTRHEESALSAISVESPENYKWVRVRVKSRTTASAFDKALTTVNCLRGIWNFSSPHKSEYRIEIGRRYPLNLFCLGPVYTLHKPDGDLAGFGIWYEPRFAKARKLENPHKVWEQVLVGERHIRKRIKKSKYPKELNDFFVRYCDALDGVDYESTYLKLWSLLELLTSTGGNNYDQTIKRPLFPCTNREFAASMLEHLRERRNRWVHGAKEINDVGELLYQIKIFVENILVYHLGFGDRFKTPGLLAELLDLPSDPAAVKKKIELYKLALQGLELVSKNS